MTTENILYTDGRDVTVTDSVLQVRSKWYSLDGITKHAFSIIQPVRFPGIFLLTAGALLTIAGGANLIDADLNWMKGMPVQSNDLALGIGILMLLTGAAVMRSLRERYAVRITTAEGEKNVVISTHKEYITQIIHALNGAFFARIHSGSEKNPKGQFTVSAR